MTDSNALFCVECDSAVGVLSTYDGYKGQCDCPQTYSFSVGSGDPPRSWHRHETLSNTAFRIVDADQSKPFEDQYAVCKSCDSDENVSVEFERVDMAEFDLKATIVCNAEHGRFDREVRSQVYTRRDREIGDFWPTLEELAEGEDS